MIFKSIEVDFYHLHINISTYNARSLENKGITTKITEKTSFKKLRSTSGSIKNNPEKLTF